MLTHKKEMEALKLPAACQHMISGKAVGDGESFPMTDPATMEELGKFPQASQEMIEEAVAKAREAQKTWWGWNVGRRKAVMRKVLERLKAQAKELSLAESLNMGMPQTVSQEVTTKALLRNWEYYTEWVDKIEGRVISVEAPRDAFDFVLQEPVGVAAVIIPWNTPNLFLGSKIAPALAAGCSVIVKPSELAPLSTYRFAKILAESELPKGLVQVLFGDARVGEALCRHPGVDKVAFTGGTAIGKRVMEQSASTLKRLTLELGGKSPNILFDDCNLPQAVTMATFGIFGLSGQACTAGSRLFVHKKIWESFLEQYLNFSKTLSVGDPLQPGTMLGPLVSQKQRERVAHFVDEAKKSGGEVLSGGDSIPELEPGAFYRPTVLTGVSDEALPACEEIFGPVSLVFPFEKEEEVLARANRTRYGLAAGVFTQDLNRALRVVRALDAGVVWVNTYNVLPYQVPFGGFKESGFGKDGGRDALEEYLRKKNVYIRTSG